MIRKEVSLLRHCALALLYVILPTTSQFSNIPATYINPTSPAEALTQNMKTGGIYSVQIHILDYVLFMISESSCFIQNICFIRPISLDSSVIERKR